MKTPWKLSDRSSRVFVINPLQLWIPTQRITSPESVKSHESIDDDVKKNYDHHSIYLFDLHEVDQQIGNDSILNIEGCCDDNLNISNDSQVFLSNQQYFSK